jgi:hypothetical protein
MYRQPFACAAEGDIPAGYVGKYTLPRVPPIKQASGTLAAIAEAESPRLLKLFGADGLVSRIGFFGNHGCAVFLHHRATRWLARSIALALSVKT